MIFNIFAALFFVLVLPVFLFASDEHDMAKNLEAMQIIINDFFEVKHICESKEKPQFSVYQYQGEETDKQLGNLERQEVNRCQNKYEIRMTLKEVDSLHVYCFDGKKPKLLVDKQVLRNDN